MKKLFLIISALSLLWACAPEEAPQKPMADVKVQISRTEPDLPSGCRFVFTPSAEASSYAYALGGAEDQTYEFLNAAMDSYKKVEGSEPSEVTFEDVDEGMHTVYAVAYDADGKQGPVSTCKVFVKDEVFTASLQYVTDASAGFEVVCPADYAYFRYAFGRPSDRERFMNEDEAWSEVKVAEDEMSRFYNYFELSPEEEYCFFAQGYDRNLYPSDVVEVKVKVLPSGSCPAAEFTVVSEDVYRQVYRLAPNDKCGMIGAGFMDVHSYDFVFEDGFNGNVLQTIDNWKDVSGLVPSFKAVGEDLIIENYDSDMRLAVEKEIYYTVYDKDLNISGLYHIVLKTPGFREDAALPEASIKVGKITAHGAEYSYTLSDNTLGCLYETIDADWFDEFRNSGDYSEYYMHERLLKQGRYWHYGKDSFNYIESKGKPLYRYYACACPMNCNGPREGGWGPLVLAEYTTLSK